VKARAALLVALVLAAPALGEEPALDAFMAKVKKAMGEVKTTRGRWKQTKRLAVFDDAVESTGTFAIRRPDHLRWEVTAPFKSVLVIAGPKGARWNETRKTVERFELAEKPGVDVAVKQMFTWYSGNFDEVSGSFDASLEKDGRTVALVPKSEKLREVMSRVVIKLASDLATIESIALEEKGGDKTDIAFEGVETNKDVPDETFELTDK
jgi:outer membrane lipoprotein-sorting protein